MATTRLEKTFTASNRKTFTISTWIKRSALTVNNCIYGAGTNDSTDRDYLVFLADVGEEDKLYFNAKVSSSVVAEFYTNRRFRDVGAFYHIVLAFDTTQATDTNRMKLYVNGEQQTFQSQTYPSQNQDMNTNNTVHKIGSNIGNNYYFDGLMSYFAFVDGTQYDASYFGETDSSSGIWKWKIPSVTYGTNGFFLKMDTSSPGSDTSGNNNTFTASGTPTLTQDNASNVFATLNPLRPNSISQTYSNGNNTVIRTGTGGQMNGTLGVTKGKWYYECLIDDYWQYLGWTVLSQNTSQTATGASSGSGFYGLYSNATDALTYANGTGTAQGSYTAMASGQIWGIAFDADNAKMYFSVNGVWENSSDPANQTNPAMSNIPVTDFLVPAIAQGTGSRSSTIKINFGNGFFGTTAVASSNADAAGYGLMEYTVPTGYYTLNTKNLNTYGG